MNTGPTFLDESDWRSVAGTGWNGSAAANVPDDLDPDNVCSWVSRGATTARNTGAGPTNGPDDDRLMWVEGPPVRKPAPTAVAAEAGREDRPPRPDLPNAIGGRPVTVAAEARRAAGKRRGPLFRMPAAALCGRLAGRRVCVAEWASKDGAAVATKRMGGPSLLSCRDRNAAAGLGSMYFPWFMGASVLTLATAASVRLRLRSSAVRTASTAPPPLSATLGVCSRRVDTKPSCVRNFSGCVSRNLHSQPPKVDKKQ